MQSSAAYHSRMRRTRSTSPFGSGFRCSRVGQPAAVPRLGYEDERACTCTKARVPLALRDWSRWEALLRRWRALRRQSVDRDRRGTRDSRRFCGIRRRRLRNKAEPSVVRRNGTLSAMGSHETVLVSVIRTPLVAARRGSSPCRRGRTNRLSRRRRGMIDVICVDQLTMLCADDVPDQAQVDKSGQLGHERGRGQHDHETAAGKTCRFSAAMGSPSHRSIVLGCSMSTYIR